MSNAYDSTNYQWWRDGGYKEYNYAFFENNGNYDAVYNEVIKCLDNEESLRRSFQKFKALLLYCRKVKETKPEKAEDFKKLFEKFIDLYMNSLIENVCIRYLFFSNGIGDNVFDYETKSYSGRVSCYCSLQHLYDDICGCFGIFPTYFNDTFIEENIFYENSRLWYNKEFTNSDIKALIPEKYHNRLTKYNEENIRNNNAAFVESLDSWYGRIKSACQRWLKETGKIKAGVAPLQNFSSLNDLIEKTNNVRSVLGLELLNVTQEIIEFLTPSEYSLAEIDSALSKIPLVPIDFEINFDAYDPGFTHDYWNGCTYRKY